MRARLLSPFALMALLAGPALAQDAGAPDGGVPDAGSPEDAGAPPPAPRTCGDLDERGRCFGDVATFCSAPNGSGQAAGAPTEQIACDALLGPDGRTEGRCLEVAGFGAWCGVAPGERCAFAGEGGRLQMACVDDNGAVDPSAACDLASGCADGAACALGDPTGVCDGERFVLGCAPFGQPLVLDCATLGGTCAAGGCAGLQEDAPCDDARLSCRDDLECVGAAAPHLGKCVAKGAPLSPAPPADAGAPPIPEGRGCSASGTTTARPWGWSAAVVLLCVNGARRRRSSDR